MQIKSGQLNNKIIYSSRIPLEATEDEDWDMLNFWTDKIGHPGFDVSICAEAELKALTDEEINEWPDAIAEIEKTPGNRLWAKIEDKHDASAVKLVMSSVMLAMNPNWHMRGDYKYAVTWFRTCQEMKMMQPMLMGDLCAEMRPLQYPGVPRHYNFYADDVNITVDMRNRSNLLMMRLDAAEAFGSDTMNSKWWQ